MNKIATFLSLLGLLAFPALAPAVESAETTLNEQVDLSVTAYNNGLALVRDVRALALPSGEVELKFMDVPEMIRPETVSLRSLSEAGSVSILEQNYEYDLISSSKLMEKYVGKNVRLVNKHQDLGFTELEAQLLSVNEGPVYKIGNDIYLGHPGEVVLPEIPENLIAKPSLIWLIDNATQQQRLEASFLTQGISWVADYVVTIPRDESSLDLAGWVTLNNQSGATYVNTRLKLVAGEVNIASSPQPSRRAEMAFEMMAKAAPPMPQEEAFAEFHLYSMPRRTTLKQNQSKQLALLDAAGVQFKKIYEYRGAAHYYYQQIPATKNEHPDAYIEFENRESNGMGMPLPAGVMRLYQEDSENMLQFAGEDRIDHTPKEEKVRLRMGAAFDVVAERVQTNFSRVADNVYESSYEITLRNHKESDISVDVVEPMPQDWTILESSIPHVKKDAYTAIFTVAIPKDGEVKLSYRIRVRQ